MKQSTAPGAAPPRIPLVQAELLAPLQAPVLEGLAAPDAVEVLRELDLVPALDECDVDDRALVGTVLGQRPEAGSEVRRGDIVVVAVGRAAGSVLEADDSVSLSEPVAAADGWYDVASAAADALGSDRVRAFEPDADASIAAADGIVREVAGGAPPSVARRSVSVGDRVVDGWYAARARPWLSVIAVMGVVAAIAVATSTCGGPDAPADASKVRPAVARPQVGGRAVRRRPVAATPRQPHREAGRRPAAAGSRHLARSDREARARSERQPPPRSRPSRVIPPQSAPAPQAPAESPRRAPCELCFEHP